MSDKSETRWPIVIVAVLAGVVGALQVGKAPPVLDLLVTEFDLSLPVAGWVLSTVSLTGALTGLLAGGVSDRIGHRRTILFAMLFVIAGCLLGANAHDVTTLLTSRFLEGVGFVGIVVSIPSILMRVSAPNDQRLVFGIWAAYMPFGMAAMMAATPALLTLTDWRGIWLVNAVATGALLGLFMYMTRSLPRRVKGQKGLNILTAMFRVLARPGPWLLAACFMAYAGQWAAMMSWLPAFLGDVSGNNMATAAWLTALVVFVNVPGNLLGSWLLQRGYTRWHLVAFGSLCMAIFGYGVFAEGINDSFRIVLAIAFSFFGGLLPTTLLSGSVLHSPTPDLTATTNGVIINGANTGMLLGPPALGALVGLVGGWQATGVAIAIGGSLALIFAILLGVVERRLQTVT
ncbi:MAG: MFS transporter [Alphaproteobacteria bacterium]|jgi:predicted MFS family arabinose efflux permease|nr:MFS transporter [Alphaproteobacteria bacterium]MBT5161315.1 MFS transporter [Alphaproteobacteria bacterium]MBT5918011.1 MFS transporter [Alphaproteobacteria bacterium]MBT6386058.1 MFS transporter [Alphaproteobacteria bacterium]